MKNRTSGKAKENPTKVFDSPGEVVAADIPLVEKTEILKNWEDEAVQLQVATDESMTGGEPSRIDEVRQAIDTLEEKNKSS